MQLFGNVSQNNIAVARPGQRVTDYEAGLQAPGTRYNPAFGPVGLGATFTAPAPPPVLSGGIAAGAPMNVTSNTNVAMPAPQVGVNVTTGGGPKVFAPNVIDNSQRVHNVNPYQHPTLSGVASIAPVRGNAIQMTPVGPVALSGERMAPGAPPVMSSPGPGSLKVMDPATGEVRLAGGVQALSMGQLGPRGGQIRMPQIPTMPARPNPIQQAMAGQPIIAQAPQVASAVAPQMPTLPGQPMPMMSPVMSDMPRGGMAPELQPLGNPTLEPYKRPIQEKVYMGNQLAEDAILAAIAQNERELLEARAEMNTQVTPEGKVLNPRQWITPGGAPLTGADVRAMQRDAMTPRAPGWRGRLQAIRNNLTAAGAGEAKAAQDAVKEALDFQKHQLGARASFAQAEVVRLLNNREQLLNQLRQVGDSEFVESMKNDRHGTMSVSEHLRYLEMIRGTVPGTPERNSVVDDMERISGRSFGPLRHIPMDPDKAISHQLKAQRKNYYDAINPPKIQAAKQAVAKNEIILRNLDGLMKQRMQAGSDLHSLREINASIMAQYGAAHKAGIIALNNIRSTSLANSMAAKALYGNAQVVSQFMRMQKSWTDAQAMGNADAATTARLAFAKAYPDAFDAKGNLQVPPQIQSAMSAMTANGDALNRRAEEMVGQMMAQPDEGGGLVPPPPAEPPSSGTFDIQNPAHVRLWNRVLKDNGNDVPKAKAQMRALGLD